MITHYEAFIGHSSTIHSSLVDVGMFVGMQVGEDQQEPSLRSEELETRLRQDGDAKQHFEESIFAQPSW